MLRRANQTGSGCPIRTGNLLADSERAVGQDASRGDFLTDTRRQFLHEARVATEDCEERGRQEEIKFRQPSLELIEQSHGSSLAQVTMLTFVSPDEIGRDQHGHRQPKAYITKPRSDGVRWQKVVARQTFENEKEEEVDDDPSGTAPPSETQHEK
jgi:hypothetical protein